MNSVIAIIGALPRINAAFGQGTGLITMSQLSCVGVEYRLLDCPSSAVTSCGHQNDAGVVCRSGKCIKMCIVCHNTYSIVPGRNRILS